jgi:hypothetical protein
MPERFGISIDNTRCGRTMPLLRAKILRLDAERRRTATNSKRLAIRKPDFQISVRWILFSRGKEGKWRHDSARFFP